MQQNGGFSKKLVNSGFEMILGMKIADFGVRLKGYATLSETREKLSLINGKLSRPIFMEIKYICT